MMFFAYVSQLTSFLEEHKNRNKRCSCDVIKGRLYLVVTLVTISKTLVCLSNWVDLSQCSTLFLWDYKKWTDEELDSRWHQFHSSFCQTAPVHNGLIGLGK